MLSHEDGLKWSFQEREFYFKFENSITEYHNIKKKYGDKLKNTFPKCLMLKK